jgi:hypothetical protein
MFMAHARKGGKGGPAGLSVLPRVHSLSCIWVRGVQGPNPVGAAGELGKAVPDDPHECFT